MDKSASSPEQLGLPGFRFHPTEAELLDFYLKRKVLGKKHNDIIATLNLYRHDPWELPGLAKIGEREWFFFVPRDRKHPNGGRPNRTTEKGYWKATGSDKPVRSAADPTRIIGLRKTLVFYEGRSPRGSKTDWVMNEYRMPDNFPLTQEEDIVLCKIYRKATSLKVLEQRADDVKMHCSQGTPETASSSEQEINLSAPPVNLKREHDQQHDNNDDVSISNSFGWGTRKETREFGCGNKFGLPELQLPNNKFSFDWLQDLTLTQLWSPWVEWPWTPFPPPANAVDFYADKQQS